MPFGLEFGPLSFQYPKSDFRSIFTRSIGRAGLSLQIYGRNRALGIVTSSSLFIDGRSSCYRALCWPTMVFYDLQKFQRSLVRLLCTWLMGYLMGSVCGIFDIFQTMRNYRNLRDTNNAVGKSIRHIYRLAC